MAQLQNIRIDDLLGEGFRNTNYAVSSNWRISFEDSKEFVALIGGDSNVAKQLSYACTSDFSFTATNTYATASIKGIPISQVAWQSRIINDLTVNVLESMDRAVEKALLKAMNTTAPYLGDRNIPAKSTYTFSGIQLQELGNDGEAAGIITLKGVQILSVQIGSFTSGDSPNIMGTELHMYVHGWQRTDVD